MAECKISLIPLRDDLKAEYLALTVHESQKTFVEPPAESLADQEKRAWNMDWYIDCIYEQEQMIGYFMYGCAANGDVWLDRFLIDRKYQGQGYGTEAMGQLLVKVKEMFPKRKRVLLSVEKNNQKAIEMYERFGFQMTDEMDGIYPVMMEVEK